MTVVLLPGFVEEHIYLKSCAVCILPELYKPYCNFSSSIFYGFFILGKLCWVPSNDFYDWA